MGTQKNYIVTGAAGFIGSHIAKKLLDLGHQVTIVDDMSTGREENIPAGASFLEFDVADENAYRHFPKENVDAVFHIAGQSSGEISSLDPVADLSANTAGTIRLLEWCLKNDVKRFLFAGTMGVYGAPSKNPIHEDFDLEPISFYGISKLASEHYIRLYQEKGVNSTIFRIFNAYGPGQNMENMKQGMASIYLAFLVKGEPITVKGSMERFRDFVYIEDIVDGYMAALDDPNSFGKTYNLATGEKILVSRVVSELIAAWGASVDYPIVPASGTPGDTFGVYADISKITSELDWQPRFTFTQGIQKMVASLKPTSS